MGGSNHLYVTFKLSHPQVLCNLSHFLVRFTLCNTLMDVLGYFSRVSRPAEPPRQPLAGPDVNLSIHPAPIIQPYWLCFIQKLLPFSVDSQIKRDDPAPLLHFHYRNFVTTTSWPAPVLRIGTLILMDSATWISSLTSERQVPAFPYKSLNQIHVTFTPDTVHPVIRFPMNLSGEVRTAPHFDVKSRIYDASTVLQVCSSL